MKHKTKAWRSMIYAVIQTVKISIVLLIFVLVVGCATIHFTVTSAPVKPEDAGSYTAPNPKLAVRVQVANFEIRQIDTQYPEREKISFVSISRLLYLT